MRNSKIPGTSRKLLVDVKQLGKVSELASEWHAEIHESRRRRFLTVTPGGYKAECGPYLPMRQRYAVKLEWYHVG